MRRQNLVNPKMPDRFIQRLDFADAQEMKAWTDTVAHDPPPGHRNYVRWVDGRTLEIGCEPVEAVVAGAVPSKPDKLNQMSLADLQTLAGRYGIPYTDSTLEGDLRIQVRAKLKEKGK